MFITKFVMPRVAFSDFPHLQKEENFLKRGVNMGIQIRRSVLFFGPMRRSDVIFAQIRIRITEVLLLRDLGGQKYSQQPRNYKF